MKRFSLLLLLWGTWGFTLGILFFLGPLRWTVDWSRSHQWTEGQEKARVYVLIVLLAILSFLLARATTTSLFRQRKSNLHFWWFLLPLLGSGFSVYAFLHPAWMNTGAEEKLGGQFTIGPYPQLEKLRLLKKEHYTTVISLLHPAVVPFEPKLMEEEKNNAKAAGLQVVNIPLLPWVSDNTAALDSLRTAIKTARGKVYIHCYLGKDRVNVARRIVEQEMPEAMVESNSFPFRSLDTVKQLERGPVYQLEKGVFFTPFPTNEEYLGYVLAANFRQVVSLADLRDSAARVLMEDEKKTLAGMNIPFRVYDVSAVTTETKMKRIVAEIKRMPSPKLVHPFLTASKEGKLFLELYK